MESKFDGRLIGQIGINLLKGIIITFSFGIATPWAICIAQRWETKHTVVDGKRLKFDGKGGQLFGKYILWAFLTVITLGIYSFWLNIKMKQWVAKHIHFAE